MPFRRFPRSSGGASAGTRVNSLFCSESPTDVGLVVGAIFAALSTLLIYRGILRPLQEQEWASRFVDNGWVPYAIVFTACWALSLLYWKWRKLRRQRRTLRFDLLPRELGQRIQLDNVEDFRSHVYTVFPEPERWWLGQRLRAGLDHFRANGTVRDVQLVLQSQADSDRVQVDGSYTQLHLLVWAIPVLGFIGTVAGIGTAVANFDGTVQVAEEMNVVRQALGNVTGGLVTAFDTTWIALTLSVLLLIPLSMVHRAEHAVLLAVERYASSELLNRLATPSTGETMITPAVLQPPSSSEGSSDYLELISQTDRTESADPSTPKK